MHPCAWILGAWRIPITMTTTTKTELEKFSLLLKKISNAPYITKVMVKKSFLLLT
jgi:hypothetical protein